MATKNLVTPTGATLYARVQTPDTHFDAQGIYHVDLLLDEAKAEVLTETLSGILDEFYDANQVIQKALSQGKRITKASFCEQMQDGRYRFKFKQRATITTKSGDTFEKKITVVDSKLNRVHSELGNGSTVKISYFPVPYYAPSTKTAGVSLRLVGVQVLDFVGFGDSAACGFTEEDGYVEQEEKENSPVAEEEKNTAEDTSTAASKVEPDANF